MWQRGRDCCYCYENTERDVALEEGLEMKATNTEQLSYWQNHCLGRAGVALSIQTTSPSASLLSLLLPLINTVLLNRSHFYIPLP